MGWEVFCATPLPLTTFGTKVIKSSTSKDDGDDLDLLLEPVSGFRPRPTPTLPTKDLPVRRTERSHARDVETQNWYREHQGEDGRGKVRSRPRSVRTRPEPDWERDGRVRHDPLPPPTRPFQRSRFYPTGPGHSVSPARTSGVLFRDHRIDRYTGQDAIGTGRGVV